MTTTTTSQQQSSRKKKIWTVVGVGALAAAVAGAGAVSVLTTTIGNNSFTADVPREGQEITRGVHLTIDGNPFDAKFDAITINQPAETMWTLENKGPEAGTFDAEFKNFSQFDEALADALGVEYQVTGTGVDTGWVDGGTLSDTGRTTFAEATGITSIAGNQTLTIEVRVTLLDPRVLGVSSEGETETLNVTGDFVVSYVNPYSQS